MEKSYIVLLDEEEYKMYEALNKKLAYGAIGLGLLAGETGMYKYLDSRGEFDKYKNKDTVQVQQDNHKEEIKDKQDTINVKPSKETNDTKDSSQIVYKMSPDTVLINFIKQDSKSHGVHLEKGEAEKIYNTAKKYCDKFKVDITKYLSLVARESHFNKNAKSYANAKGLGQLMKAGGEAQAVQDLKLTDYNIYDIDDNIKMSVYYLGWCLKADHGDFERALARYNGGSKQSRLYDKVRSGELKPSQMDSQSYEYVGYITKYHKQIKNLLTKNT